MRRVILKAFLLVMVLLLNACSQWQPFGSLLGSEPPPNPPLVTSKPADPVKTDYNGQAYYVGASSISVHADSKLTSPIVGRFSPYEAVTRTKIDGPYAFVISAKSGLSGWVDNGQLIWRLPPMKVTSPSTVDTEAAKPNDPGSPPQPAAPVQPPDPPSASSAAQSASTPALKEPKMYNPF